MISIFLARHLGALSIYYYQLMIQRVHDSKPKNFFDFQKQLTIKLKKSINVLIQLEYFRKTDYNRKNLPSWKIEKLT